MSVPAEKPPVLSTAVLTRWPLFMVIGLRYTRAKRRNQFISFMSLSSILGIALGIIALITVLSIMSGFEKELRERILGMTAHLLVSEAGDEVSNWQDLHHRLLQADGVVGAAPYVQKQGLVTARDEVKGVLVRGIHPDMDKTVSELSRHMILGNYDDLQPKQWGVFIGEELADSLQLTVGDTLKLIAPEARLGPMGFTPRIKQLRVKGIFQFGMHEYDSGLLVMHMNDAQVLFRLQDKVSGIQIETQDLFDLLPVKQSMANLIEESVFVTDWRQQHANFFRAIAMEKRMMFIVLTLIIAVAAFNIVSSMVMLVTDKQADIAIMRTLGMTGWQVGQIFIVQGFVVGALGVIFGVIGGILIALNIEVIVPFVEQLFHIQFFPPDVYYISQVPSHLIWSDVYHIAITAFVLTILSTLYPAYRAAKVQPAEALRYE